MRATPARAFGKDEDAQINQALVRAASDKNWVVRASALLAIAKREDPKLLNAIVPALSDKNEVVRFTAAAAVIRLTMFAGRGNNGLGSSRRPHVALVPLTYPSGCPS